MEEEMLRRWSLIIWRKMTWDRLWLRWNFDFPEKGIFPPSFYSLSLCEWDWTVWTPPGCLSPHTCACQERKGRWVWGKPWNIPSFWLHINGGLWWLPLWEELGDPQVEGGLQKSCALKSQGKRLKDTAQEGKCTNELGSKAPLTPVIAPPSTTSLSTEVGRCLSSPLWVFGKSQHHFPDTQDVTAESSGAGGDLTLATRSQRWVAAGSPEGPEWLCACHRAGLWQLLCAQSAPGSEYPSRRCSVFSKKISLAREPNWVQGGFYGHLHFPFTWELPPNPSFSSDILGPFHCQLWGRNVTLPLPESPSASQHSTPISRAVKFYLYIFQDAWCKAGLYFPYFRTVESLTKTLSSSTLNRESVAGQELNLAVPKS